MAKRPIGLKGEPSKYEQIRASVGDAIRSARLKSGLNQTEFGLRVDLKAPYVSELESGRTNVTLQTLVRLAVALELEISDLFPTTRSSPVSRERADLRRLLERLAPLLVTRHEQESALLAELFEIAQPDLAVATRLKVAHSPSVDANQPTVGESKAKPSSRSH